STFSFQKKRNTRNRLLRLRSQFRKQEVDAARDLLLLGVRHEKVAILEQVVANVGALQQDPQGVLGFGQGHVDGQRRAVLALDRLEREAGLLPEQAVQLLGMSLQLRPNRMQRTCQIRPERKFYR